MGSKPKTTQKSNQTQTVAPPSWTMPGIQDVAGRVTDAIGQIPQSHYTGDFVAAPDYAAANAAYGTAAGRASELGNYVTNAIGSYNTKPGYDLTGMFDAALHPLTNQLNSTLGQIRTSAADSGAYSGSRANAILPSLAMKDYDAAATDALSKISYQDYSDTQNRNLQYYNMLPSLVSSALQSTTGAGDIYSQIAQNNQQQQQGTINNNLAKEQYQINAPFQGLDIATQLLNALSGGYGTTTSEGTNTTTQKTGGAGAVVSGLAGLASLAGSFAMPGGGSLGGSLLSKLFTPAAAGAAGASNASTATNWLPSAPASYPVNSIPGLGRI